MYKHTFILIFLIVHATVLAGCEKGATLSLKPKLNHPYRYEAQMTLNTTGNSGYSMNNLKMLVKIDYIITFINDDLDFYLELEGIKGFSGGFSSYSKRRYFNTYDSAKTDRKQEKFKQLFLNKRFLISAEGVISAPDHADHALEELLEEGIIQPLIRQFQRDQPNLENVKLKKGHRWETTDSVSVKNNKYVSITNRYFVKDKTSKKIFLTGIGQGQYRSKDITLAQRLTFDKKSGLPQSVHQYMQIGDEMELYAMVKAKGADVPDPVGEYLQMESIKLRNKLNIEHKVSNTNYMWPLPQDPFKTPSTKELNLQLDQYLDSLQQHSTPLDGVTFVYMDESSDQPFSPPLQGAYVQTGAVSVVSEKGDTLSLTSRLWNTATGYYPLSHLGPYHADLYSPQPNVKAYHVDLTVHIATQTEKLTLTDRRNTQGKFSMEVNDSTFTLTYQHDRIKLYEPYPMHSITCYDKNGKIVTARPLTTIYRSQIKETVLYTPLELAEIYSNLDERRYSGSVSYIFEAKDVNKVVLETYTNTIPITKTFSGGSN